MSATRRRFSGFLIAALLAGIMGCASAPTPESAGAYLEDSAITAKVKAAILGEASLKVVDINVETHNGGVQLSGFVGTRANMDTAVAVTRAVGGVTSVQNDMLLRWRSAWAW